MADAPKLVALAGESGGGEGLGAQRIALLGLLFGRFFD